LLIVAVSDLRTLAVLIAYVLMGDQIEAERA
jgi:hypothetical protein